MALSTSESGRAPAPSRRGSRGVYVEDFHTVAVTLRTIGDAIPIFGGVLKATAGLAVAILDASERVSIAREMSKNLAVRAAQLVVVILQEAAAGDLPVDTLDQRYHPFIVILEDALYALNGINDKLKTRRLSWLKRSWRIKQIEDVLNTHTIRLNNAMEQFNLAALIDLHKFQVQIAAHLQALSPSSIEHNTDEPYADIFCRADIKYLEPIGRRLDNTIYYRGEACNRGGGRVRVLIKQYTKSNKTQLKEDLCFLSQFMHSNLPMVIGRSPLLEESPYLLVTDDASRCAKGFVCERVRGDPVSGFMSVLTMMRDIVSALRYLSGTLKLSKPQLELCSNPYRFGMTPHGTVMIGQDLLTTDSAEVSFSTGDPKLWLMSQCYWITMSLIYGERDAIKWDQWDSSQTEFPHLRLLLNLANISCPSVDTLDSTLSQLATRLNTLSMDGSLTYQHIREAALEIPHYIPTHRYLPTAAQSVASIGDIGYMRGDTFVKLDSMASEFCEGFGCMPNHSVASATIASDILEDGSFRHQVNQPNYINFRRWGTSKRVDNPGRYWNTFTQKACKLISAMGENRAFKRSDLILVTVISSGHRSSEYRFHTRHHVNVVPPDVTVIERCDDAGLHHFEWEYDTAGYDASQFTIVDYWSPRFLCYMQMEEVEYDEMSESEGCDNSESYDPDTPTSPSFSRIEPVPLASVSGNLPSIERPTCSSDRDVPPTPQPALNRRNPDTSDRCLYEIPSSAALKAEIPKDSAIAWLSSCCAHAAPKGNVSLAAPFLFLLLGVCVVVSRLFA